MGMGVVAVAAIYARCFATQHGYPPPQRLLLLAFEALGFVCAMRLGLDLQEQRKRYKPLPEVNART
jgi:hypothetical protein